MYLWNSCIISWYPLGVLRREDQDHEDEEVDHFRHALPELRQTELDSISFLYQHLERRDQVFQDCTKASHERRYCIVMMYSFRNRPVISSPIGVKHPQGQIVELVALHLVHGFCVPKSGSLRTARQIFIHLLVNVACVMSSTWPFVMMVYNTPGVRLRVPEPHTAPVIIFLILRSCMSDSWRISLP